MWGGGAQNEVSIIGKRWPEGKITACRTKQRVLLGKSVYVASAGEL